jgi:tetratricopeptide (TPR) repeat protein
LLRLGSIGVLLVAATLVVYSQSRGFDFIYYDDLRYVTQNPRVQQGLTLEGARWSFALESAWQPGEVGMWHPLTWLSLMIDHDLWGLDPAGFHLTNVVLHGMNVLALFAVLRLATGALWRSAIVAALFAVHPLNVEVVAFVQQRKDLLAALFGLLSIGAYATYARRGGAGAYLGCFLLLAAGLCSKPMLVTFPLLFLLLDYWPLARLRPFRAPSRSGGALQRQRSPGRLIAEKIPLLALGLGASIVNWMVQPIVHPDAIAFRQRVANMVVAYASYLVDAVWPSGLAILYPHPYLPSAGGTPLPGWKIAASSALLLAFTAGALRMARRGYPIVGWLWYLGTLFPTIGMVQVGIQARADRYTYIPLIGLYIVAAWGAHDLVARHAGRARWGLGVAGTAAAIALALFAATARSHARHWRDSVALFEHTLEVAPRNPLIHYNLGIVLASQGEIERAIEHYRRAVEQNPRYSKAHANLAHALLRLGRTEEGLLHYRLALELQPHWLDVRHRLASALASQGRGQDAIEVYRAGVELDPRSATAHTLLAEALRAAGRLEEAAVHYRIAFEIAPSDAAREHLERALGPGAGTPGAGP